MAFLTATLMSDCLKRSVPISVILPCDTTNFIGTGVTPAKPPYKTLYLMHGTYGSELDWVLETNLHRLAKERQMAVIMPAGENHFYTDDVFSGIRYGEFIGKELVDVTRRMFRLSNKREDTYIGGLSMGGYGALLNGLQYHDTFGYIAAMSTAAVTSASFRPGAVIPPTDNPGFRKEVFGIDQLEEIDRSEKNLFVLIEKLHKENVSFPELYITAGKDDPLCAHSRMLHEALDSKGIRHIYQEDEGGHNFEFWQKAIVKILDWLPHSELLTGSDSGNVFAQ